MIVAGRGDAPGAAVHIAESLTRGEASGASDALVRALRSCAEAHLALGQRAEAEALAHRAYTMIERTPDAYPAEDLLGVLVTLLDAGASEPSLLGRAVSLA